MTIALIDYGAGNIRSATKAFEHVIAAHGLDDRIVVTSDPEVVARADRVVLPGDGFLGDARNSVVANNPAVLALFNGQPRGFSETHKSVFEPRLGVSYSVDQKTVIGVSVNKPKE